MLYISLSAVCIKKVNNFNKTLLKHIEYAESEFPTFEFVICKFIVVYMNMSWSKLSSRTLTFDRDIYKLLNKHKRIIASF